MAFGKTAAGLILALAASVQAAEFTVRHEHLRKGCNGVMTVDSTGIAFAGLKGHAWKWNYGDIQQLKLGAGSIHILTYQDSKLRLGADRAYEFTGHVPAGDLYRLWSAALDQRFVANVEQEDRQPIWSVPAKRLRPLIGSQGTLLVTNETVVYSAEGDSRTWRYTDIDHISSASPFQLTVATIQQEFNFQLKQRITEARYNQLWLDIERKNGKIQ